MITYWTEKHNKTQKSQGFQLTATDFPSLMHETRAGVKTHKYQHFETQKKKKKNGNKTRFNKYLKKSKKYTEWDLLNLKSINC